MTGAFVVFCVAILGWWALRALATVTEWQRRTMWVVAVLALVLPSMSQLQDDPLIQFVLWPAAAGTMVAELGWQRWRRRSASLVGTAAERRGKGPSKRPRR